MKSSLILTIKMWLAISILPFMVVAAFRLIYPLGRIEIYYCFQIIVTYLVMLLLALYWKRKYQIKFNFEKSNDYRNKRYLLVVILAGVGFSCFFSFAYYIPCFETSIPSGFTEESFAQLYNSFQMILSTSVLMPIIEEILFRGVLQVLFIRYLGLKWGIILNVGLFSLLHGNGFLFCFIFTLFIAYVYIKTKNIVFPIVGHVSNNLTNVILEKMDLVGTDKNMLLIIFCGTCLLCLSILILVKNGGEMDKE